MNLINKLSFIFLWLFLFTGCKAEFENGVSDIDSWDMADEFEPTMVHPGVLHTKEDFEHIRQMIEEKKEPYYATYQELIKEPKASAEYSIQGPFEIIARDGTYASTKGKAESDFDAIYLNAVMWMITQDENYAKKSLELMLAYAEVLK